MSDSPPPKRPPYRPRKDAGGELRENYVCRVKSSNREWMKALATESRYTMGELTDLAIELLKGQKADFLGLTE